MRKKTVSLKFNSIVITDNLIQADISSSTDEFKSYSVSYDRRSDLFNCTCIFGSCFRFSEENRKKNAACKHILALKKYADIFKYN